MSETVSVGLASHRIGDSVPSHPDRDQRVKSARFSLLLWFPLLPLCSESAAQLRWWDAATVSLQQKELFLRSALQTCAAWLSALHIKHPGLSVSAQAAATKSASPAWSARILAVEFCTGRD